MSRSNVLDVESLFEEKPVVALREIELKTRNEIEDKKNRLREVVGGSYRFVVIFVLSLASVFSFPVFLSFLFFASFEAYLQHKSREAKGGSSVLYS